MRAALFFVAALVLAFGWGLFVGDVLMPDAHLAPQIVVSFVGGALIGHLGRKVYEATG